MDLRKKRIEEIREIRINGDYVEDIYSQYIDFLYQNYCDKLIFNGEVIGELSAAFENLKTGELGFLCYNPGHEMDNGKIRMIILDILNTPTSPWTVEPGEQKSYADIHWGKLDPDKRKAIEKESKTRIKSIREYIKDLSDYLIFSYIAIPVDGGTIVEPYLENIPQISLELEGSDFWTNTIDLVYYPKKEQGFLGFYVSKNAVNYENNSFYKTMGDNANKLSSGDIKKFYLLDEEKYQDLKGYCSELCLIGKGGGRDMQKLSFKNILVKKVYGFPYKNHKSWNVLIESEDCDDIQSIRFKKERSAKRFWKKNKKRD